MARFRKGAQIWNTFLCFEITAFGKKACYSTEEKKLALFKSFILQVTDTFLDF